MVTMDRKDWQRSLQLRQGQYFASPSQNDAGAKKSKVKTIDSKINPANFNSIENMHAFVEQSTARFRDKNQERLKVLKNKINILINELYEMILQSAYAHENHRVPFHGIPNPKFENPVNLF